MDSSAQAPWTTSVSMMGKTDQPSDDVVGREPVILAYELVLGGIEKHSQ